MKLNKKVIGLSIAGLTVAAAIPAIAITLTSCGAHNKVGDFYDSFNSPYKELDMYAQTMDAVGLKLEPATSSDASTQQKDGSENLSFSQIATKINNSMRDFVQKLAATKGIQDLTQNKNTTVLFVKNDSLNFNKSFDEDKKLSSVNKFQMEQPILYSQIYSTPSFEECPGFGFKFPAPINSKSNSLFDNWFEIGASQLSSEGDKSQVPNRLASSWRGTADFVFYLYNSENMSIEDQKSLVSYINGFDADLNSKFLPARMLKTDGVTKHVIPLDIQWMYDGIWDQVGSFTIDYLFAQIFNNINTETKNIKWFYNLNFQPSKNKQNSNVDVNTVNDVAKNADWNPYRYISSKANKTDDQPQYKLGVARPSKSNNPKEENQKINFATTMFNTTGHALSLGVNPDYISINLDKQGNNYQYLAGYLRPYLDIIAPSTSSGKQYDKFYKQTSGSGFVNWLESSKVYALADNRDTFGKLDKTPWPLPTKPESKTYGLNGIIDLTHETSPTDSSVLKVVKPVYTERNDSSATQQNASNISFVYDSKTNKAITVNVWKEQQ